MRSDAAEEDTWVLLATIGLRDPAGEHGEPTGPLRAALGLRPATVILLHSAVTRPQAEATADRIGREASPVDCRLHLLEGDPTDQGAMLERCRDLVEELRAGGVFRRGCPVEVCATSGTPAMGMALTLAAGARYPWARHWQALDPRRAGEGAELLRESRPEVLRVLTHVADGFRLLRDGRPGEAVGAMERYRGLNLLGRSAPFVDVAIALARLLDAVAEYVLDDAAAALAGLRAAAAAAPRTGAPVQRLADWYERVVAGRGRRSPAWPLELAAAARREFAGGRRLLGVVRLAAAAQVAVSVRLVERHRIDPTDVGANRFTIESMLGRHAADAIRGAPGGRVYVDGWFNELRLLGRLEGGELQREIGQGGERLSQARQLTRRRNDLLHAGGGVTADDLRAAFDEGTRYVGWLFEQFGWGRLDDVPSMPAGVTAAVNWLADAARVTVTGA